MRNVEGKDVTNNLLLPIHHLLICLLLLLILLILLNLLLLNLNLIMLNLMFSFITICKTCKKMHVFTKLEKK
jgi:hypothetical protein